LIVESGGELGSPPAASRVKRRLRVAWSAATALGVLLVASVVLTAVLMFSGGSPDAPTINFEIPTPAYNSNNQIAISPTGSHLAAQVSENGGMLWVRALE